MGAWRDDVALGNGGGAYVFVQGPTGIPQWTQQSQLIPGDIALNDGLGYDVAIEGRLTAVGSPFDDDVVAASGSVYVYLP